MDYSGDPSICLANNKLYTRYIKAKYPLSQANYKKLEAKLPEITKWPKELILKIYLIILAIRQTPGN